MKNLAGSRFFLLAFFSMIVLPRTAGAAVVWTATHEAGNLSEWMSGPNPTKTLPDGGVRKNVEVLGEQVYSGKFACKITVHPDDTFGQFNQDRVDIQHASTLTGEGKDSYLSGFYYLPEDAKTRNEIAFYETRTSFRNWMDLWVEPKTGGGTTVKFGIESNGANLGSVLVWTGDWSPRQWHQFAIHVHWSTNATLGVVDLWFDGQQVVTGYKHNTKFDTNDMFFNTGLHRVLPQPFVETIYFDDFIEADALADIKIGAPTPGGAPDGGTRDAASTADTGGAAGADGGGAGTSSGAAGASSGVGGAGASGSGGAGNVGSSGAAGNGVTGRTGSAGTGAATTAGTGGAGTTGSSAPADSAGGCACVMSASRSTALRLQSAAFFFAALVLAHRRRRRSVAAR